MNTKDVLEIGGSHLYSLSGHVFDVLTVSKPTSTDAAINLSKVISKLSPLIGNLIEFNTVDFLNAQTEFKDNGEWKRQDPGFPDTIFVGSVNPTPGFEIKTWFPLSTEITARFKDSQNHFSDDQTNVCLMAWLPEELIFGRPKILDVCVVSGLSVAKARDDHYHNPPDYLVLEPEDTSSRTSNLQQTNTNGYKWQGSSMQFKVAEDEVRYWGKGGKNYKPTSEYQQQIKSLFQKYNYRLDTNFAKMDRIVHKEIEEFKTKVLNIYYHGMKVDKWARLLSRGEEKNISYALDRHLKIK